MMQGKSGLAYVGVNALQPPDVSYSDRAPTTNDYIGYGLMHLWHVVTGSPHTYQLWYLADKSAGIATWLQLYPNTAGGGGNLRSEDLLIESPDPSTGAINVYGGEPYLGDTSYINMYTTKLNDYTLYVNLKRSICQPFTNVTGTEGVYSLGKVNFLHAFGTNNTFLGLNSVSIPSVDPVNAKNNTAIGSGALTALTLSENCTVLGYNAAHSVSDGVYVTAIGSGAGSALGPSDSSCILIGHPGINSDTNLARIGVSGTGDGEIDKFYLGGVWNRLPTAGKDTGLVIIDEDEKLSTYNTETNSILGTDANGNPIALKGDVGTFLVGHGLLPADPYPSFLSFKLDDPVTPTVTWATDPITGQIILTAHAGGAAGITSVPTDAGIALPAAGVLSILGGELIETDAATPNTVTVNLTRGADRQIVVGNTGAASTYRTLLSSDGSIDVDFSNPAQVNLKLLGVPPVGGINYLMDHALLHVPPISNGIQIEQGANITTVGDALNAKITVAVTDSVELPSGHLLTRDYIETTAGDIISDAGNLRLPVTTATGTQGVIMFGAIPVIHCRGGSSTSNIFVGPYNNNFATLDTASATYNSSLGRDNLKSLTTSAYNTALGGKVLDALTSGYGNNTSCGYASGSRLLTGAFNTYLGEFAGYDNTGSESHNLYIRNKGVPLENRCIRIGTDGEVDGGQTACYIAAIHGKTPGPTPKMVTIGSDGKLGTTGIPSGGATTFNTDSGTATVSGTTIQIKGGYNIGTRGATNIVTVDVDGSIQQGNTTSGGAGIYALGTRGANTYTTNRFMHNYGTSSTYLGYQAGPISGAGGTHCTGLGFNALMKVAGGANQVAVGRTVLGAATTSSRCTALGSVAGTNVTTGNNNVLVGFSAGNAYTTESHNIILGGSDSASVSDAAVAGDSRVMRLGFNTQWSVPTPTPHDPDPVETKTVTGTDSTYIYGIYRSTVDASGTPVYVDRTGKLGTEGGAMFAVRQTTTLTNVTGDGTFYKFGTSGGLTIDFDNTSSLSGGSSSTLIFTAPYYGKYCFVATVTYSIPKVVAPVRVEPIYVVTSNISYVYTNYLPAGSTATIQYVSEIVHCIVYLDAGDTVWFGCYAGNSSAAKNLSIPAYLTLPVSPYSYCYGTHFEGYRIS